MDCAIPLIVPLSAKVVAGRHFAERNLMSRGLGDCTNRGMAAGADACNSSIHLRMIHEPVPRLFGVISVI